MPTPSSDPVPPQSFPAALHRTVHTTCPPEDDQIAEAPIGDIEGPQSDMRGAPHVVEDQAGMISGEAGISSSTTPHDATPEPATPSRDMESSNDSIRDIPTPMSILEDPKSDETQGALELQSPSASGPMPAMLKTPYMPLLKPLPKYTPSFLRHGSKFAGTQESDRQVYKVQVEIKHVDMAESFICGYLRIEGLTADHPTLTTYFEGEIIGNKYTFQTRHAEWGSNEKVDMQHWHRFQAWRPLARAARRPDFSYKNFADREHIFMRWKEYFLVPDHRVRTISGASFEGFYYICFNQRFGTVSGIYFHARSEKYQQLELKHVDDQGCLGAVEFR